MAVGALAVVLALLFWSSVAPGRRRTTTTSYEDVP
jgi:hypothetical protein